MARGSLVKRCSVCRKNGVKGQPRCNHKEAVYVMVYWYGRKQKWETVGPNKKEAERRLAETVSRIHNGAYSKPEEIIFRDFVDKWLEEYAKISVKLSTYHTYRAAVYTHLVPIFGDLPLLHITTEKIQRFVSHLLKKRSPKTVNNLITQLKTMLKYARRWGYLRDNPALDIDHVRCEHKEMDFLNPDEIQLFLKAAREPFKALFLTAIMTGMRRGELLGLQWGDIDWNSNAVFVRRSVYFAKRKEIPVESKETRWKFMSPKSKRSVRAIVMSPILKEALELHRIKCLVSSYDLVFPNREGNPMDPSGMINREFLPTLTVAGLRKIRFHDLRHTYTSLLIAQGENIKFIQSQLGHASIQTTLDRYGHILPSNQHGVGARLDSQVFGNYTQFSSPKASDQVNNLEVTRQKPSFADSTT